MAEDVTIRSKRETVARILAEVELEIEGLRGKITKTGGLTIHDRWSQVTIERSQVAKLREWLNSLEREN